MRAIRLACFLVGCSMHEFIERATMHAVDEVLGVSRAIQVMKGR